MDVAKEELLRAVGVKMSELMQSPHWNSRLSVSGSGQHWCLFRLKEDEGPPRYFEVKVTEKI